MSKRKVKISLAGSKPKRKPPQRIFSGAVRKAMVEKAMDILSDWNLSPFENEGSTLAGLRSGLCLKGFGWRKSNNEASLIVGEALKLLGACERPSYGEGQWQYSLPREMCANCLGPLDDEAIADRDRFCCDECKQSVRQRDGDLHTWLTSFAYSAAAYAVFKTKLPESDCEWCGKRYKMVHLDQRFCSRSCANAERAGDRLVKPKPCLHCGTMFRGWRVEAKFCSSDCHKDHVREHGTMSRLPPRHCDVCKRIFTPKSPNARLCSDTCANLAKVTYNRMKRQEKRAEWQQPKQCEWCGESFTPARPNNVFCSTQCNDKAQKAKKRAKKEAAKFICEEVDSTKKAA